MFYVITINAWGLNTPLFSADTLAEAQQWKLDHYGWAKCSDGGICWHGKQPIWIEERHGFPPVAESEG